MVARVAALIVEEQRAENGPSEKGGRARVPGSTTLSAWPSFLPDESLLPPLVRAGASLCARGNGPCISYSPNLADVDGLVQRREGHAGARRLRLVVDLGYRHEY